MYILKFEIPFTLSYEYVKDMGNSTARNAEMIINDCNIHEQIRGRKCDQAKAVAMIQKDPKIALYIMKDVYVSLMCCINLPHDHNRLALHVCYSSS